MGKKRTAIVDGTVDKKEKKAMFRWEEAYNDLPIHLAIILREARVKPDQLKDMPDGEILALGGVSQDDLALIHTKYPAAILADAPVKQTPQEGAPSAEAVAPNKPKSASPRLKYPTKLYGRSKQYKAKKSKLENKTYPIADAFPLLKKVAYGKFQTVELHLNVKETDTRGEISLPHSTGKQTKIVIFSPEVEAEIKLGKTNFDILLATTKDMALIAPLAKILGPKGLMPSPKNGTIVENPQERAKKLQAGATLSFKTEPKAPLIHLSIGNLSQPDSELQANLTAVINGIGLNKILSVYLKSTMSPAIKLDLSSL